MNLLYGTIVQIIDFNLLEKNSIRKLLSRKTVYFKENRDNI